MVFLRSLLALPELGLQLVAGASAPDVEVRWAHVSELDDPTPWLEGGELLLTTGLPASWEGDGAFRYCQRLVERGVVALGVSCGSDLTYQTMPAHLQDAAERTGLRLLLVPYSTPLQSVVRAVADAISSANARPLRSQIELQRKLMLEAASGSGLDGAVARIRSTSALQAAVYDVRLDRIAGPTTLGLGEELRRRIRRQLLRDREGSISIQETEGRSSFVLPLVADGNVRGYLLSSQQRAFSEEERALLKVAAPILGLLLDLREVTEAPLRRARVRLAGMLLTAREGNDQLPEALAAARLHPQSTCVVCVRTRSVAQRRALLAGLSGLADDVIALNEQDQTSLVLCDPAPNAFDLLVALADEIDLNDVGVGEVGPLDRTPQSHVEAVRAQSSARMHGLRVSKAPRQGHQLSRLFSADHERLRTFAQGVLAPLEAHDHANPRYELLPTLRAYFDSIASIEASSTSLQIHRHTMRARLKKISELTGYDITESSQYLELWLAIELRHQSGE
ncbi:MAG: PucR family transcriptional regulator ligand-binding domain-containing protein [Microbacterium sp.]